MASTLEVASVDDGKVTVVRARAGDTPQLLAEQLGLASVDAVVVLAGGASDLDARRQARLTQLFGRGLLRALGEFKGLCVLRARDDRVAELAGACAHDALRKPLLLGVAPAGQVDVAAQPPSPAQVPALSHLFVAVGDHWGDERRAKIELIQALKGGRHTMLLLVGGEPGDLAEVLQAVRRHWPIVVIKGSGGAADLLLAQQEAGVADHDDPLVAEILADGHLTVVDLDDVVATSVEVLSREVERACGGLSVLRQVWQRFAALDAAAIRQQRAFMRNQLAILALGVAAVVLAALQTLAGNAGLSMTPEGAASVAAATAVPAGSTVAMLAAPAASAASAASGVLAQAGSAWLGSMAEPVRKTMGFLLIVVPILLSVVVAGVNRFSYGKRWVLLRAAAEGIKREIYLYRLHAHGYAADDRREKQLKNAVEDVTRRLARTEVNTLALTPYVGPIPPINSTADNDDGLSLLSTDQYVRLRLQNQLAFYRRKSVGLEATMKWVQYLVLIVGGVGTLFGAFGGIWVIGIAITTAVASALASYLTFKQVETTLMSFNQTATDLENIEAWWLSLEPDEQKDKANIEQLGRYTERILETEVGGWSQRMSDALEKLRAASEGRDGDDGNSRQVTVSTRTSTTLTRATSETVTSSGLDAPGPDEGRAPVAPAPQGGGDAGPPEDATDPVAQAAEAGGRRQ